MNAEQRLLFERQMETFAGFAEHTDNEVGRLVAQLEKIGALENSRCVTDGNAASVYSRRRSPLGLARSAAPRTNIRAMRK